MNELNQRFYLLAIALGLKESDHMSFIASEGGKKNYECLFSTYIKMIEQDQDEFFIDKARQLAIITSLKNTLFFYKMKSAEQIEELLHSLKSQNPSSFLLLPLAYTVTKVDNTSGHTSGMIIYKNIKDDFLVTLIDKEKTRFDQTAICITISQKKLTDFSSLLWTHQLSFNEQPYYILNAIMELAESPEKKLNIDMPRQYIGNCAVSEIEATLKTVLFNCRQSIFDVPKNVDPVTPKWHSSPDSTLEMRKRFLKAIKVAGQNEWNQLFDEVFLYYISRKNIPRITDLIEPPTINPQWKLEKAHKKNNR